MVLGGILDNYMQFYTKQVSIHHNLAGCTLSPLRGGDLGEGQICKRGGTLRDIDLPV